MASSSFQVWALSPSKPRVCLPFVHTLHCPERFSPIALLYKIYPPFKILLKKPSDSLASILNNNFTNAAKKEKNASRKITLLDKRYDQNVLKNWKMEGRDSFQSYIQLLHQHSTLFKLFIIQNVYTAPTTYVTIFFPMTLRSFKTLTIP